MKKLIVKEESNKRIDAYIQNQINEYSRTCIQRLLEEEKITVNGKKVKA